MFMLTTLKENPKLETDFSILLESVFMYRYLHTPNFSEEVTFTIKIENIT